MASFHVGEKNRDCREQQDCSRDVYTARPQKIRLLTFQNETEGY